MNPKKNQEKNKFSKLKLRSASVVSKKSVSPYINQRETISKYFSTENESQLILDSATESQCAQILPQNINIENSLNDENDFIPTQNVKSKVFEKKSQKDCKVPKKRPKKKNDLSRFIRNADSSSSDTNQEHLHLALAMSKSLEEFKNPGQNESVENPYPNTQEKLATIKKTLDQFGFRSERCPIEIPTLKHNMKHKKKFKYITPTLFLRTEEDRLKLIESNVSAILTNISVFYNNISTSETTSNHEDELINNKPRSFLLRDYYNEESTIFKKNDLSLSNMEDSKFYNNIVPIEIVKAGVLLKDWGLIPGRQRSPPPNITVEETEDLECMNQNKETENERNTSIINRSISPDLFSDSDVELSVNKLSPYQNNSLKNKNNIDSSIILVKSPLTVHGSNTDIESDKEIFSDNSDTKSLSLLDSISPRRNKSNFVRKNKNSSAKKTLFHDKTSNLKLQNVRESISPIFSCSPIKTYENDNEICHFESFCDNSNDIFDLTQSSNESNKIFDANTIITTKNIETDVEYKNKEHNLALSNIEENEQLIDLTQSSNDSKKIEENDFHCHFQKTILTNKNISSSDIDEFDKDTVILQKKLDADDSSSISTETVLLIKNTKAEENSKYIKEIETNAENIEDEFNSECDIINSTSNKNFYDCLSKTKLNDTINNISQTPKRKSKLFRKSLSENISHALVDTTDFFKLSSPLNFTEISENKNSLISQNINMDKSLENILISNENNDNTHELLNYNVSHSSADTNSDISDEELNYSTNNSFRIKKLNEDHLNNIHYMDFNDLPYSECGPSLNLNETLNQSKTQETVKHPRVKTLSTPKKFKRSFSESCIIQNSIKTPEDSKNNVITITPSNDYIIKTSDITPMPKYEEMDTPQITEELDKFGIKPLKRARGIQLLRYLYEATHPILQKKSEKIRKSSSDEDDNRIIKRSRKMSGSKNIRKSLAEKYEEAPTCSEIANSENDEDMIFERKQSVRIASCRLPLHIAWHNLVSSSQELHEKILLYEPIQIEEIYAKFKSFGFKFHIQDIISFLDKKCITIKIAQNQKKPIGS